MPHLQESQSDIKAVLLVFSDYTFRKERNKYQFVVEANTYCSVRLIAQTNVHLYTIMVRAEYLV
jgi:hypothetical protein